MSKSMCGRKAAKPGSRAAAWLGRDEGFPLGSGRTGMRVAGGHSAARVVSQKQKPMRSKCSKE